MASEEKNVNQVVDHLFRHEAGRMVAVLTRLFGLHNIELAEDVVQDTLHQALQDWPFGLMPDNPAAWLITVAKRKAINTIRREKFYRSFAGDIDTLLKSEWTATYTMDQVFLESEITDSQLRMIFTCCHPDLPTEAQVALTLKTLCGFSIAEIAAALLTTESNINKRLYRAKEKIRNKGIDFSVPTGAHLQLRLDAVLLVIYLLFNEGYNSTGDNPAIRKDLCLEALRLAMLLTQNSAINEYPAVYALLALLCLHSARLDARIDNNDCLVILEDQDRRLWNHELIQQGMQFLAQSAIGATATAYHLEAAIAAEHCMAPDFASTNWQRIHDYYTALEKLKPSSVIRLNLAIVIGKKDGPEAAIALLHQLETHKALENSYLLYTSLGEFYYLAGKKELALDYFLRARTLTRSPAIRQLLDRKMSR
ncbi:RNA polymerase sigma factor [Puia dinghuensis]|uniref:RNA polymerase subunit sigma-24 n=1 Tax=Puia dinghuensis TaxID=1792502 RepID=A0A8J2UC59_9BACT|nr:sigma-70 family RNA polymerase sigma factor [Puia dinghuensis]GGA94401.1 RNA polymerase subunit sigma-24 [Puia dinghuensis]